MNDFRVCTTCGYGRGFHLSIKGQTAILICPSCGSSYDIGLRFENFGNVSPQKGESFRE